MRSTAVLVCVVLIFPLIAGGRAVATSSTARLLGTWEMVEEQDRLQGQHHRTQSFEFHNDELRLSSPEPAQHWRIVWRRLLN